jgi:hypothetical protein
VCCSCAADYKRYGNGIIAQGAVWNGEDAILKGAKQKKDREDGHEKMRVYLLCTSGSTQTLLAREIESRQGLTAVGKQQGGLTKGHNK